MYIGLTEQIIHHYRYQPTSDPFAKIANHGCKHRYEYVPGNGLWVEIILLSTSFMSWLFSKVVDWQKVNELDISTIVLVTKLGVCSVYTKYIIVGFIIQSFMIQSYILSNHIKYAIPLMHVALYFCSVDLRRRYLSFYRVADTSLQCYGDHIAYSGSPIARVYSEKGCT